MTTETRTAETIRAEISELQKRRVQTCGHGRRARITAEIEKLENELAGDDIRATLASEGKVLTESGEIVEGRKLSELKKGEFFKRKPDAKKVYQRGEYCRSSKKFYGEDWDDISRAVLLKGSTVVFVGFEF